MTILYTELKKRRVKSASVHNIESQFEYFSFKPKIVTF